MNRKGSLADAATDHQNLEDTPMKIFLAAVAFSLVTASVWYGVLDMQQRTAAEAFAAPSSVRL